ncbi:MAG: hypothetical protein RLZZ624_964 [Cyanobacteriota bacterium]
MGTKWASSSSSGQSLGAPDGMHGDLQQALVAIRRRLLPFLFVLYVVAYLDRVNVSFVEPVVSRDLGMTTAAYGFAAGIFFLGYVIFEIPSNLMLERVGARAWISRILFTWGVIAALMACMVSPTQFNGLRLLLGVAEAGFYPGIIFYLSRWVPEDQRARTLSGFLLALPVAGLLGGPISAAILSLPSWHGIASWRWLFLLEALPALLLSVAVFVWLPNRPHQASWLMPAQAEAIELALQRDQQRRRDGGRPIQALSALWGDRRLWLLSLLYLGIATSFYGFSFWIPKFVAAAVPQAQASPVLVNLLSAIPYAFAVLGMLLVGRSADRHRDQRWHVVIPLMVAALALVVSVLAPGGWRLVLITLATAAVFSSLGPTWAIPLQFLEGRAAAAGIAAINSFGNIGGFLAPFVIGRLISQSGGSDSSSLLMLAALMVISAGLTLVATQPPPSLSVAATR